MKAWNNEFILESNQKARSHPTPLLFTLRGHRSRRQLSSTTHVRVRRGIQQARLSNSQPRSRLLVLVLHYCAGSVLVQMRLRPVHKRSRFWVHQQGAFDCDHESQVRHRLAHGLDCLPTNWTLAGFFFYFFFCHICLKFLVFVKRIFFIVVVVAEISRDPKSSASRLSDSCRSSAGVGYFPRAYSFDVNGRRIKKYWSKVSTAFCSTTPKIATSM